MKSSAVNVNLKNGNSIECEQIRFCSLSSGVKIGLFRDFAPFGKYTGSYILIVKQGKQFLHQYRMLTLVSAIQSYLDYICRYA